MEQEPEIVALARLTLMSWSKYAISEQHKIVWQKVATDFKYCTSEELNRDLQLALKEDEESLKSFSRDFQYVLIQFHAATDNLMKIVVFYYQKVQPRLETLKNKKARSHEIQHWYNYSINGVMGSLEQLMEVSGPISYFFYNLERTKLPN